MSSSSGAPPHSRIGVRIAGTGSALPTKPLSNTDLEKLMDTTDEWIVQRTGIRKRLIVDRAKGECTTSLSVAALQTALAEARLTARDLDLIIVATMTPDMSCPPVACFVAGALGTGNVGAFDINGACTGFIHAINTAHSFIKGGGYRTVGVIGADCLSTYMDYSTKGRSTAIIFGDAAGAVVLRATDDPSLGVLAQTMHSDGTGWKEIYIPEHVGQFPPGVEPDPEKLRRVQMNGASVFKFAVGTFPGLIEETLEMAGLKAADIDMFVCHQSNQRILHAARDRFGLTEDKLYVNIDRYGNTVAASVPLCLDELRRSGRVRDGHKVMMVAFGAGLTWGSSLWQF